MHKIIKIESKIINIRVVENAIDEISNDIKISKDSYGKVLVSTLEAVNNAILHGNKSDPKKFVYIEIFWKLNELIIKVADEGSGFKHDKVPDPTIQDNIESVNGRGVFLMSRLTDKLKYNRKGNTVTMVFKNIIS